MRGFVKYYIFTFITLLILIHPQHTVEYARGAMTMCADVLCPSLFPFFVCSGLLVYSGFCEVLSKIFRPVMRPLFNVSGSGAAAFVLGIISGYPIGAETACRLYENGSVTKNECERLLAFCNNSGPLFILGSVGVAVYHSPKIGAMLYFVHILAAFTVGIIFRFYRKGESVGEPLYTQRTETALADMFSKALSGSVTSILTVCGAVVFFSVVANLIADLIPDRTWRTVFVALSELTSGIKGISDSELSQGMKVILSAATAGFAGACVHLQVMSVAHGKRLSLRPYIIGKVCHAMLSALYMSILLRFFPLTKTVFASGSTLSGAFFAASVFTCGCAAVLAVVSAVVMLCQLHKKSKTSTAADC
ncbi:MAG: sporulation protein [Clostridia bacterium]|nr:sporulation protein [Clostridia bacterium]